MTPCIRIAVLLVAAVFAGPLARAGDAAADWQHVVTLDAGPKVQARTQEEARAVALGHLDLQEKALRSFIAQYPDDPHFFEARLRLARLLRIRGDFQSSEKARAECRQILADLAKTATTPEQHAEVDFTRLTTMMLSLRDPTAAKREELLNAVHNFQLEHSADRRLPALLAETATLFDAQPKTKDSLLRDALRLATDEELKGRITDDLKRLDFLGKEVPVQFTSADGKSVDLAAYRGKVVLLIFFAAWSPPSMAALEKVQKAGAELPRERVQILGISLDEKSQDLAATLRQSRVAWPVGFDGKSWEGPLVRSLGVNTLPTLWLFDAKGHLRSLNALDSIVGQTRQLLDER